MSPPDFSIVISTLDRPQSLAEALASIAAQTHRPRAVIVVDASTGGASREVCEAAAALPLQYRKSDAPSSAMQRNAGAESVRTPLIAFMDDDVVLRPETMEKMCAPFADDPAGEIGGIGGRIDDQQHPRPRGLLWLYYRIQAGYWHPTYGGKVFGPAINCLPCYDDAPGLIPGDWLNSTCVVYRTPVFAAEKFPEFTGYSYMEDVHLSTRVARKHRLYFEPRAIYAHRSQSSSFKKNHKALAQSHARNRRLIATEILGQRGPVFALKSFLQRLFESFYIVRHRNPGWIDELIGTWTG